MINTKVTTMIDFKSFTVSDKEFYKSHLQDSMEYGCEFSFANLFLWGRQSFAVVDDHIVIFSQFDRRSIYPYPVGAEDSKHVIDSVIADAKARGIPCRITGLNSQKRQLLESLYPGKFRFHCDESNFDYVYSIDDLAELKGKKYHGKRNHLNRFYEENPNYRIESINEDNLPAVTKMIDGWYDARILENPNVDYHMERAALNKALANYADLDMEGIVIFDGENILAVTIGSRLSNDTFDVHFEKARADINGAYTAINCEFAKYIRNKYPDVRYLNREDDMGLEGLRKAKKSYHPHHMVEKYWACFLEDGYDY